MKVGEILRRIPSLTRDDIYNWQRQGYFSSRVVRDGNRTWREYDESAVTIIARMAEYYSKGFPPRVAHSKAVAGHEVTGGGEESSQATISPDENTRRRGVLGVLVSGSIPLIDKLRQIERAWQDRSTVESVALSYPARRSSKRECFREVFEGIQVQLSAHELKMLAEYCLEELDAEADAVITESGMLSVLLGAMCLIRLEAGGKAIQPWILENAGGIPKATGGRTTEAMKAVLLVKRVGHLPEVLKTIYLLQRKGHRVLQVIALAQDGHREVRDKLMSEHVRFSCLLSDEDIAPLRMEL